MHLLLKAFIIVCGVYIFLSRFLPLLISLIVGRVWKKIFHEFRLEKFGILAVSGISIGFTKKGKVSVERICCQSFEIRLNLFGWMGNKEKLFYIVVRGVDVSFREFAGETEKVNKSPVKKNWNNYKIRALLSRLILPFLGFDVRDSKITFFKDSTAIEVGFSSLVINYLRSRQDECDVPLEFSLRKIAMSFVVKDEFNENKAKAFSLDKISSIALVNITKPGLDLNCKISVIETLYSSFIGQSLAILSRKKGTSSKISTENNDNKKFFLKKASFKLTLEIEKIAFVSKINQDVISLTFSNIHIHGLLKKQNISFDTKFGELSIFRSKFEMIKLVDLHSKGSVQVEDLKNEINVQDIVVQKIMINFSMMDMEWLFQQIPRSANPPMKLKEKNPKLKEKQPLSLKLSPRIMDLSITVLDSLDNQKVSTFQVNDLLMEFDFGRDRKSMEFKILMIDWTEKWTPETKGFTTRSGEVLSAVNSSVILNFNSDVKSVNVTSKKIIVGCSMYFLNSCVLQFIQTLKSGLRNLKNNAIPSVQKTKKAQTNVSILIDDLEVFTRDSKSCFQLQFKSAHYEKTSMHRIKISEFLVAGTLFLLDETLKKNNVLSFRDLNFDIENRKFIISTNSLNAIWSIPTQFRIMDVVNSIKLFVKGLKGPSTTVTTQVKKRKSTPATVDIRISHLDVKAIFTPTAKMQLSIAKVKTHSLLTEPIRIFQLVALIQDKKIAAVDKIDVTLNDHPELHSQASFFTSMHNSLGPKNAPKLQVQESDDVQVGAKASLYLTVHVRKVQAMLPYMFPLGNFLNEVKNAKKILIPKGKGISNKGRILPLIPRIFLILDNVFFEFDDHPVEKALIYHRHCWDKEYASIVTREEMLEREIKSREIPSHLAKTMRKRLQSEHGEIYFKRLKRHIKSTKFKGLMSVVVRHAEVDIFRPEGLNTYDDVIEKMIDIDDPPFQLDENGKIKDFGLLAAIGVKGKVVDAKAVLRNHIYPLASVKFAQFQTTVLPMYVYGQPGKNTILKRVDVGLGKVHWIPGSLTGGVRVFYEANVETRGAESSFGQMLNPIFKELNQFVSKLIPKSGTNPSPKVRWWDKIRLVAHGKLRAIVRDFKFQFISGYDPYDPSDSLEMNLQEMEILYKARLYEVWMTNLLVSYNPSLVSFNLAELPKLYCSFSYEWECGFGSEQYFFPTEIPDGLKTVDDVATFQDKFDLYEKWRITGLKAGLRIEAEPGETDMNNLANPTIMFNPLACSWFINFINSVKKPHFQLKTRSNDPIKLNIKDFQKELNIFVKVKGLEIIWSNGYARNHILHITSKECVYERQEFRDTLPDITVPKKDRQRVKFQLREHAVSAKNFEVYVYDYDAENANHHKCPQSDYHQNIMLSIDDCTYKLNNDNSTEDLEGIKDYQTYMIAKDLRILWSSRVRDALFTWIDMISQFIFTVREVEGNKTEDFPEEARKELSPTTPIEIKTMEMVSHLLSEATEKGSEMNMKEILDKFLIIILVRPVYALVGDETHESMVFQSNIARLEFNNLYPDPKGIVDTVKKFNFDASDREASSLEASKALRRLELMILANGTEVYWVNSRKFRYAQCWDIAKVKVESPFPVCIQQCPIIIRYTERKKGQTPRKNLILDFPFLNLYFSSTQIRAFIDIISNVLVPKKKGEKVILEDQKLTLLFLGKLAPEQWASIRSMKEKCLTIRTEIRNLLSIKRSLEVQLTNEEYTGTEAEMMEQVLQLESSIKAKKQNFHSMKQALQNAVSVAMNTKNSSDNEEPVVDEVLPDFKITLNFTNIKVHLRGTKSSLLKTKEEDQIFMVLTLMDFRGRIVKNNDFSALQKFTVHEIKAENLIPNSKFDDLLEPYKVGNETLRDDDYMMEITMNKSCPVGGIQGYEHFQITIAPLQVRFTYDLYRYLWAYLFPQTEEAQEDKRLAKAMKQSRKAQNKEREQMIQQQRENTGQDIHMMKYRATNSKLFNYVQLEEALILVSFHGPIAQRSSSGQLVNYVGTLIDSRVHIKPIVYQSEIWTWKEFFNQLKQDILIQSLSHILPDTVKAMAGNKVKGITEMLNPFGNNPKKKKDEEIQQKGESKRVTRTQKFKKILENLAKKEDKSLEDPENVNELQRALLFGEQNSHSKK